MKKYSAENQEFSLRSNRCFVKFGNKLISMHMNVWTNEWSECVNDWVSKWVFSIAMKGKPHVQSEIGHVYHPRRGAEQPLVGGEWAWLDSWLTSRGQTSEARGHEWKWKRQVVQYCVQGAEENSGNPRLHACRYTSLHIHKPTSVHAYTLPCLQAWYSHTLDFLTSVLSNVPRCECVLKAC